MDVRLQPVQALLRRTRLLSAVMAARYGVEVTGNLAANRRFARAHPDFPTPPSRLAFDAYAHVSNDRYRTRGREVAAEVATYVRRHVPTPEPAVLEWGCGCARVLRHLPDELPRSPLTGSDYNPDAVGWCRANLPGIRFELNGPAPPLPFDDGAFDFVFALSVLTHLSEAMHHAWFGELRRVTRPGGVILVSAHGEALRSQLLADEAEAWRRGDLVVRSGGGVDEGRRMYLAFHPEAFMRERLLDGCEVLDHVDDRGPAKQDFWIVRRP